MENGEIYKMELDGKILGKFGRGGKRLKEFMAVHEMDCRTDNQLYVGEISNWRVQKLTLHPPAQSSRIDAVGAKISLRRCQSTE